MDFKWYDWKCLSGKPKYNGLIRGYSSYYNKIMLTEYYPMDLADIFHAYPEHLITHYLPLPALPDQIAEKWNAEIYNFDVQLDTENDLNVKAGWINVSEKQPLTEGMYIIVAKHGSEDAYDKFVTFDTYYKSHDNNNKQSMYWNITNSNWVTYPTHWLVIPLIDGMDRKEMGPFDIY